MRIIRKVWERKAGARRQLLLTIPAGCNLKKGDYVVLKRISKKNIKRGE